MNTSTEAAPRPQNRTNVRITDLQLRLLRAALRGASIIAPQATEKLGAEMFFRPMRRARPKPPRAAGGLEARRITVTSGGDELATWLWGEGPTVLLAHGWNGRASQMAPFVAPLREAGLRVVAFDMPGHGSSTGKRASVLTMARAIRDVAEATAPLVGRDLAPLYGIIAHSLGATATALALRGGLSAGRVVLLAPGAEPMFFARRAGALLGLSEARTEGLMRRVSERLGGDMAAIDLRSQARSIAAPALIVHDPEDEDVPFAHGEGIAEAWPGAELEVVRGLGHLRILRDEGVQRRAALFIAGDARP
jgi:pimeloyl-ACP methyl ester carboxylesterase